jgi:hypothetical protein
MLRIRKVKTKSGSTAIQVVQYTGHSAKIVKHIGSAKDDIERGLLIAKAQEWIGKYTLQSNLFTEQKQNVLIVERSECVRVTHDFAYQFFRSCLGECHLTNLPSLLLDLAIIRLIAILRKSTHSGFIVQYPN